MIENPSTQADHISNLAECVAKDIKELRTDTSRAVYTINNVAPQEGNVDIDIPPSGVHVGDIEPDHDALIWIDPDANKAMVATTVNGISVDDSGNINIDHVEMAERATQDGDDNNIVDTYAKKSMVGSQLIDYTVMYDSIMNRLDRLVSKGGRKLYRHESGKGTVIKFNDGQDRKVLVLDAKYRAKYVGTMSTVDAEHSLPNYNIYNTNKTWTIDGSDSFAITPASCKAMTDVEFNSLWIDSIDVNTSKYNTDYWLTQAGCDEATYCRSVKVNGIGCDVPNIQTLMRIYLDAPEIDRLDITLADYPEFGLCEKIFQEGTVRSSTEMGYDLGSYCARIVAYNGQCGCTALNTSSDCSYVIPVLEL